MTRRAGSGKTETWTEPRYMGLACAAERRERNVLFEAFGGLIDGKDTSS